MSRRPSPPATDCASCAAAERPPVRLRDVAASLALLVPAAFVASPQTRAISHMGRAMAGTMTAAAGGTGYDRHRAEWIRSGELLELERMVRHVTLTYPDLGPRRQPAPPRGSPGMVAPFAVVLLVVAAFTLGAWLVTVLWP